MLAIWFVLLGNTYAGAFGAEAQHDAVWNHEDASCRTADGVSHGYLGHLSAHIVAIEQLPQPPLVEASELSPPSQTELRPASWYAEPVSPPPKSLA